MVFILLLLCIYYIVDDFVVFLVPSLVCVVCTHKRSAADYYVWLKLFLKTTFRLSHLAHRIYRLKRPHDGAGVRRMLSQTPTDTMTRINPTHTEQRQSK